MGGAYGTNGGNEEHILVGKLEAKRPLGRPRRRWMNCIKVDLGEIGWGGVNWIGLVQDGNKWRDLVNASDSIKCGGAVEWLHNWWRLE
jgi:hypothetical protein